MLPAMPRMPGLLRAEAEQARGMQIRVKRMNIGIGVMQYVVLLTPEDVTAPYAIYVKPMSQLMVLYRA